MTFCIGIRVHDGLVALADTRIVRGDQSSLKAKLSTLDVGTRRVFVMTSGLRSVRDKVVCRLEDRIAAMHAPFERMHALASAFGDELRRVREEDAASLEAARLSFNLHAILGGTLPGDPGPELIQVFPEGNWVQATEDAPYFTIGRSHYGKPILDRLLGWRTPIRTALTLGYLAFDATRASVVDVDFPIDVAIEDRSDPASAPIPRRHRFDAEALIGAHDWWHDRLEQAVRAFPTDWTDPLWRDGAPETDRCTSSTSAASSPTPCARPPRSTSP